MKRCQMEDPKCKTQGFSRVLYAKHILTTSACVFEEALS